MMLTWSRLRVIRLSGTICQLRTYRAHRKSMSVSDNEFPRITVPQQMQENLQKHKVREALQRAHRERPRLKSLVLASKNKQYNHYKGQKFDEFNTKNLASHGWKHRRCGADYFTLVPRGKNPSVYSENETVESFEEMGLDPRIAGFLKEDGIDKPTKIQSLMIPVMLKGQHILAAAETGSGKTYAYLLPIIHMLLNHNRSATSDGDLQKNTAPFGIIVAPSRELVTQIADVCSVLAESIPFSPVQLVGGKLSKIRLKKTEIDIVITTSGMLEILIRSGLISLSRLNTVVLDEADSLLDDSFIDEMLPTLTKLQVGPDPVVDGQAAGGSVQMVLVSATYPRNLEETVGQIMPLESFTKLTTEQLHCLMPHVQQNFLRMRSVYKLENIVRLLKKQGSHMYMVFCNTTNCCFWLSKALRENGIQSVCLTSKMVPRDRGRLLQSFFEGRCDVLICTDIASRGLDTFMVDHVVNFDFPKFISDYIHRVGRVGRVGSQYPGQVTSFVTHSSDIELTWKIEMAARQDKELHNVNANAKRVLRGRAERAGLAEIESDNDDDDDDNEEEPQHMG